MAKVLLAFHGGVLWPLRRVLCAAMVLLCSSMVPLAALIPMAPMNTAMAEQAHPSHVAASTWRVVDGDTIHTEGHKIRLLGIDTPEMRQTCQTQDGADWPCGKMARDLVVGVLDAQGALWCRITGRDRYQRLLGQCFAGRDDSGIDIQHMLVRSGFAVAEYTATYRAQEAAAQRGKNGLWRVSFLRPKDWRRRH